MSHLYDILQGRFVKEVFVEGEYLIGTGIVFDVGALNGEYALYTYNTADRIICIEANPTPAKELAAKVSEYGLTKIKVYQCALSDTNGDVHLGNLTTEGGCIVTDSDRDIIVPALTLVEIM
jgi:FkbM family methyltransferase